jgi:alpha-beta hydrolase superfamily lysophospholipase
VTYAASILGDTCPPLFLSSPLYRIKQQVPQWKKVAARTLPRVAPLAPVPHGIEPENISENQENNAAYVADELNLSSVTARFGELFLNAVNDRDISASIASIKTPVTVVYGGKDKLVDPARTRDVFPQFNARHARLQCIEEAGHEIFNETPGPRAEALSELMRWIDSRGVPEAKP